MPGAQVQAAGRSGRQVPPHPSLFLREAVTVPFWVGLWEGRSPRTEGVSPADPSSHPGEKHPWPGASSAPPGAAKGWAWPGCSCVGPRAEGIKGSHVGPAFISRLQRGANKLCPRARRQLPPRGPGLLSPSSSCSFPESQQCLISGHPRGAPTPGHAGGSGGSAGPGKEGAGTLTPAPVPTTARLGAGGCYTPACSPAPAEPSWLEPAVQCGGHAWLPSTGCVARLQGDVPEAFSRTW